MPTPASLIYTRQGGLPSPCVRMRSCNIRSIAPVRILPLMPIGFRYMHLITLCLIQCRRGLSPNLIPDMLRRMEPVPPAYQVDVMHL